MLFMFIKLPSHLSYNISLINMFPRQGAHGGFHCPLFSVTLLTPYPSGQGLFCVVQALLFSRNLLILGPWNSSVMRNSLHSICNWFEKSAFLRLKKKKKKEGSPLEKDPSNCVWVIWKLILLMCPTDPDTAPVIQGVDVINSTLVKVTWSTVPKERVHGHLKGYQVFIIAFLLLIVKLIYFLKIRTDFRSWKRNLLPLVIRCGSVPKSCPALCYPMDYSTPGFSVLHIRVHWVGAMLKGSYSRCR